jgi:large repetitive protein
MKKFSVMSGGALVAASLVLGGTAGIAGAAHTPKPPVSTVTSVVPDHGPVGGGTIVKIKGKNLVSATAVDFDGTATTFSVDGNALLATSPPEAAGTYDVTVTTADGTTQTGTADEFTYESGTPTIGDISPKSGAATGGTKVTISGSDLAGTTAVDFGSTPAVSFTQESPTTVLAVAPAEPVGTVAISVTAAAGTTPPDPADQFSYKLDAPRVTSVAPDSGPAGTSVTITGSGFSKATAVDFGGTPAASYAIVSGSSITASAPAGSGVVDVTVTDIHGTSGINEPADEFTYTAPPSS